MDITIEQARSIQTMVKRVAMAQTQLWDALADIENELGIDVNNFSQHAQDLVDSTDEDLTPEQIVSWFDGIEEER